MREGAKRFGFDRNRALSVPTATCATYPGPARRVLPEHARPKIRGALQKTRCAIAGEAVSEKPMLPCVVSGAGRGQIPHSSAPQISRSVGPGTGRLTGRASRSVAGVPDSPTRIARLPGV